MMYWRSPSTGHERDFIDREQIQAFGERLLPVGIAQKLPILPHRCPMLLKLLVSTGPRISKRLEYGSSLGCADSTPCERATEEVDGDAYQSVRNFPRFLIL